MRVTGIRMRGILDSRAAATVEAEVTLADGTRGRGSCPRAIAPGLRERPIGGSPALGPLPAPAARLSAVVGPADTQAEVDARLADDLPAVGVSAVLAVSVAYARAGARATGVPLWRYLADLAGTEPGMPRLLVNIFSGGIHDAGPARGYQQVMAVPRTGSIVSDIEVACRVWAAAAAAARQCFGEPGLSASSGLMVPLDSAEQLQLLTKVIADTGLTGTVRVGVDVAAEHLYYRGAYRLGDRTLTAAALAEVLCEQASRHDIEYLEDPFDSGDESSWRALPQGLPASTRVVGDDLFATDAIRIEPGLAGAILLKPSQIGTVSGVLAAAARAHDAGLAICVSHRSGETDDTVICDLATALGADLIKVGGPRRGDRLAKYNQLLRLAEEVPTATPAPTRGEAA
ncbi:hypothetical protein O7627_33895 [Solwaraspora sp. WMMD1047]|uniref:hypothetical protein n=1 Tax=Solwaraspora sp. WMMD1047 TaxID=3016102 RepID=UPI002417A934|nr:hypothetical protein [Solwaraspora sp. WMMD1047]MDG4834260.1 hypothetical protein [Solwaraspora sp. WMMD1047]